jgi:hypothetical protein
MATNDLYLFDPSVRFSADGIITEIITIKNLRAQVKKNKDGKVSIDAKVLEAMMVRIETLHRLLNSFEYSSDGFIKRYPEKAVLDNILNNEWVDSK